MIRAVILSLLLVCQAQPPAAAQTPHVDQRILDYLTAGMLARSLSSTGEIGLDGSVVDSLNAAGIHAPRFADAQSQILETENVGQTRRVLAAVQFNEQTGRRLFVILQVDYRADPKSLAIENADLFWNSPPMPEVQARWLPPNEPARGGGRADTYLETMGLLARINDQSIEAENASVSSNIAIFFIDRIALDASVRFVTANSPEGEAVDTISAERLDETGWPIFLIAGRNVPFGYLQVRYTPGSDTTESGQNEIILDSFYMTGFSQ